MASSNFVHLENYIESATTLSPELERILRTIRVLDDKIAVNVEQAKATANECCALPSAANNVHIASQVAALRQRLDDQQIELMQWSDEKINLAYQALDLIEGYSYTVEQTINDFEAELQASGLDMDYDMMGRSTHAALDALTAARQSKPKPARLPGKGKRDRDERSRYSTQLDAAALPPMPIESGFEVLPPAPIGPVFVMPSIDLKTSSKCPQVPGRLLTHADINTSLVGMHAELYWPDDNLWYLIQVLTVDVANRTADIIYATGETEQLNLDEIVNDAHMSLICPDSKT